jgi:hypothetical protein
LLRSFGDSTLHRRWDGRCPHTCCLTRVKSRFFGPIFYFIQKFLESPFLLPVPGIPEISEENKISAQKRRRAGQLETFLPILAVANESRFIFHLRNVCHSCSSCTRANSLKNGSVFTS